jgi:hypothetical protein
MDRLATTSNLMCISDEVIVASNPTNGLLIVLAEVYIDESGTGGESEQIVLAGYIFLQKRAKKFSKKFGSVLDHYDVPYFHAKECLPCKGVFDHLCMTQCDLIARRLIRYIHAYSEYGFIVHLDRDKYFEMLPEPLKNDLGGEYSFCARQCLTLVKRWANRSDFKGQFSFFFENGHEMEKQANRILRENFAEAEVIRERFQFCSHSFVDKRDFLPLAAADYLAYHFSRDLRRGPDKPPRKDFEALLRPQDMRMNLSEANLTEMMDYLRQWVLGRSNGPGGQSFQQ